MGKDWRELGDSLETIIEAAVRRGNFGHLNDSISKVIGKSFQSLNKLRSNGDTYGHQGNETGSRPAGDPPSPATTPALYFAGAGKRRGAAIARLAGGIALVGLGLLGLLVLGLLLAVSSGEWSLLLAPAGVVVAGSLLMGRGLDCLKLSGRFDQYVRALKGKSFSDIQNLAALSRRPQEAVLKDLKQMLRKGWFLQGHLDQSETCLMVSDETYQQYLATVDNVRQQERTRREQEAKREEGRASLSPEAQAVIDRGREYIRQIRRSNDNIPGVEASEKMSRMEHLVEKIFQQVELHPENIRDLRKLMEYYLPTTIKLLNAYEELDRQPVQGEHIARSKAEIMKVLDTLNTAFEKLLDNLFQDSSLDIAADISVLQTMLAQDGLTDEGFPRK